MAEDRNLSPARGPSVWARSEERAARSWRAGIGGIALVAAGAGLAVAGTRMAYRALKERATPYTMPEDLVTHESEQSFPASDSPSWTPTSGSRPGSKVD